MLPRGYSDTVKRKPSIEENVAIGDGRDQNKPNSMPAIQQQCVLDIPGTCSTGNLNLQAVKNYLDISKCPHQCYLQRRLSKGTLIDSQQFGHSMNGNSVLLLSDVSLKNVLPIVHYFEAEGIASCCDRSRTLESIVHNETTRFVTAHPS
jgi:hypothetical protein